MSAGRPTKYDPEFHVKQAFNYSYMGATIDQMASFFDLAQSTMYEWLKEYPAFSEAIKKGKDEADNEIVKSLYKRAKGYEVTELTFEKVESKDALAVDDGGELTVDEQWKKKVVKKELAPDPVAAIFWLKNRRPGEWRDKVQTELTGPDGGPIQTQTEHVIKFEGMGKKGGPEAPGEGRE